MGAFDKGFSRPVIPVAATPDASEIAVTPVGDIAASNVQSALEELDSEKETPAGAQAKVDTHEAAAAPHSGHETPAGAQTKVDTHANLATAHGAVSAATASKMVVRDASGRAQFGAPSAAADAAIKDTVDTHAALTTAHGAVSAATASTMVVRDSNGRVQFATPSVDADAAIKGYVDVHQLDKVFRIGHTYAIPGEIKVPSGDTDFVIPFFVSLATGQTAYLVKARYKINSGTSVTAKLTKNGGDITGFTSISVTTTAAETDPADVALANNDLLALVVTAVSGTPKNLSFTLFIEYTQ